MLKRSLCFLGVAGWALLGSLENKAVAECGEGTPELVGHISDIFFDATSSAVQTRTVHGTYKQVSALGGTNCDVYAFTYMPLQIEGAYDNGSCAFGSQGQTIGIGQSGLADSEFDFGGGSCGTGFEVKFQGPITPTSGVIVLLADEEDIGFVPYVIGYINVYIDPSPSPADTWFIAKSTSSNTSSNKLTINHDRLNNNPDAKIFVSNNLNPPGAATGVSDFHPVQVRYDSTAGRWLILNADNASMPIGTYFNVRIDPSAYQVQAASGWPTDIVLDDDISNANPYAVIAVTAVGQTVDTHPIVVKYDSGVRRWRIKHADGTGMIGNMKFNVRTFGYAQYVREATTTGSSNSNGLGIDMGSRPGGHGSTRTSAQVRTLPNWSWLDTENSPIILTNNATPTGDVEILQSKSMAVDYDSTASVWKVKIDGTIKMRCRAAYNIWAEREDDTQWPPPILQ